MQSLRTDILNQTISSLADLADRTMFDLLALKKCVSEKLIFIDSLNATNEQLMAELRLSRESEELAYEKLKRLREISCLRESLCSCMECTTPRCQCICAAYPAISKLQGSDETKDQLSQRITALEQQVWQVGRQGALTEVSANSYLGPYCNELSASAKKKQHKIRDSNSNYRKDMIGGLLVSHEVLKNQFSASPSEMASLRSREKSLSQEAATLARMLSKRDEDITILLGQTAALNTMVSQRNEEISRLEVLLQSEKIRSERNREIAAKVKSMLDTRAR